MKPGASIIVPIFGLPFLAWWSILWASFWLTENILSCCNFLQNWLLTGCHYQGWQLIGVLWLDLPLFNRGLNLFRRYRWLLVWRCQRQQSRQECGPCGRLKCYLVKRFTPPCRRGRRERTMGRLGERGPGGWLAKGSGSTRWHPRCFGSRWLWDLGHLATCGFYPVGGVRVGPLLLQSTNGHNIETFML